MNNCTRQSILLASTEHKVPEPQHPPLLTHSRAARQATALLPWWLSKPHHSVKRDRRKKLLGQFCSDLQQEARGTKWHCAFKFWPWETRLVLPVIWHCMPPAARLHWEPHECGHQRGVQRQANLGTASSLLQQQKSAQSSSSQTCYYLCTSPQ